MKKRVPHVPKIARARRYPAVDVLDRHALYEVAVQGVEWDLDFLERVWRYRHPGRTPKLFREDFCSTAALATAWVRRGPDRRAWGVDLDPEPLAWARRHRLPWARDAAKRVKLVRADVRRAHRPLVDVACALNFSWWIFRERHELLRYLRAARAGLKPGGVLVLNMYGGLGAEKMLVERTAKPAENAADGTPLPRFTYVWEQKSFDPIDRRLVAHIHFELRDGRRVRHAFTYDWRMYTVPEIAEALAEAGFRDHEVWSEGWDASGKRGNGTLYKRTRLDHSDTWVAYVVATR
jgi:SAM-dependent methyltransferase